MLTIGACVVKAAPARSTAPGDQPLRPRALVAGLSVVVLTVAVLQTAVVPVLGIIADQLNASTVGGQLGGHRESARRRRGDAVDRPARRPAQ